MDKGLLVDGKGPSAVVAALRAPSFRQDSAWYGAKATYATKPKDLLDDAADLIDSQAKEIEALREALKDIAGMTDPESADAYRADDREGCLDTVFAEAARALLPLPSDSRRGA